MATTGTATTDPRALRLRWHNLVVAGVERLTEESAAITLEVPPVLADEFAFRAGQHLTFRVVLDDVELRRSYSICVSPAWARRHGQVKVGVKHLHGGAVSTWLLGSLRAGDRVEVQAPQGHFGCTSPTRATGRHHVGVVAGSGITPVLAMLSDALETDELSTATLLYGNRRTSSIMFLEELEGLKNRFPARLQLVHVLSREPQEAELLSGRLDVARLEALVQRLVPVDGVDEWYLCGPYRMVVDARDLLTALGADPAHVHLELFHVEEGPPAARSDAEVAADEVAATVTVNLDGRTTRVEMATRAETILAATLRARPDAPYACTGGVCGTCRARLVAGEVRMDRNYALQPEELARGLVLACQSHPLTDEVALDYDA